MPHLTGRALAIEVLKLRPDMKILMVSGLADGLDRSALHAVGIGWVLQKPHTAEELHTAVRVALGMAG